MSSCLVVRMPCLRRPFQSDRFLVRVAYVSTDLRVMTIPAREAMTLAEDLRQQDSDRMRIYRRLTLHYWLWLCMRMDEVESSTAKGKYSAQSIQYARQVMAFCDEWILSAYKPKQIIAAKEAGLDGYRPPIQVRGAA